MKAMKYTIQDFRADFPTEDACLEWLKDYLYPDGIFCPVDKKITKHYKVKSRKSYSCAKCGHHVHPTADTIFHKSPTPLTLWFYAIYLMSATRSGISAKQLERELGVTYKTAWRMFHQIRKMMSDTTGKLTGPTELDEMYVGPVAGRRSDAKSRKSEVLFGAVERKGRVKVVHVKAAGKEILAEVEKHVDKSAPVYTDGFMIYKGLYWKGYSHKYVNHAAKEWVRGDVHTNNIENFWSNMRRGVRGVYRHVDPKYLQAYADEYAFRYSNRESQSMFWTLLGKVAKS